MLEDLKLPILQQRRLETRLVMLYKVVRGMVPAINADEFLIPIRNKRNIKPRVQSDFQTTNIVEKFSTNHSECFKIPDSHTEQYRNSFFVSFFSPGLYHSGIVFLLRRSIPRLLRSLGHSSFS